MEDEDGFEDQDGAPNAIMMQMVYPILTTAAPMRKASHLTMTASMAAQVDLS